MSKTTDKNRAAFFELQAQRWLGLVSCGTCGGRIMRIDRHCEDCGADETESIDLDKEVAVLESIPTETDNVCDACAGKGTPVSGKPCMCGGSGKMSDAAVYLREQLVKVNEGKLRRTRDESELLTKAISEFDVDAPFSSLDAIERRHNNILAILAETEANK